MTPNAKDRPRPPATDRRPATVVTVMVPCDDSRTGQHPITIAIAHDGTLLSLRGGCRDSAHSDALLRLGGASCVRALRNAHKAVAAGWSYSSRENVPTLFRVPGVADKMSARVTAVRAWRVLCGRVELPRNDKTSIMQRRLDAVRGDMPLTVAVSQTGARGLYLMGSEVAQSNGPGKPWALAAETAGLIARNDWCFVRTPNAKSSCKVCGGDKQMREGERRTHTARPKHRNAARSALTRVVRAFADTITLKGGRR